LIRKCICPLDSQKYIQGLFVLKKVEKIRENFKNLHLKSKETFNFFVKSYVFENHKGWVLQVPPPPSCGRLWLHEIIIIASHLLFHSESTI